MNEKTTILCDEFLYKIGLTRKYKGYDYTKAALILLLDDESRLYCLRWRIFEVIATENNCEARTVETDIRTAIQRTWHQNPTMLIGLARYELWAAPPVSDFLRLFLRYVSQRTK